MGDINLSVGALSARVSQVTPMVIDLTDEVEVRVEREDTVVPPSPQSPVWNRVDVDLEDVFNVPGPIEVVDSMVMRMRPRALDNTQRVADQLEVIPDSEEEVEEVEPVLDFAGEEARQALEMRAAGAEEMNAEADRLVAEGLAPVPYEDAPDGDFPPEYVNPYATHPLIMVNESDPVEDE